MIDEHKEELAAFYALGLLSGEELSAFEAELHRNSELRELTDSLQKAGAHLALTAPQAEPSAALRARILASAASITPAGSKAKVVPFPISAWAGWAVAAGFAIFAGYAGTQLMNTRAQLNAQRDQAALTAIEYRGLQQKLEADHILSTREIADLQKESSLAQLKIAKLASLNGNSPEAVAIAVWNPLKQEGILAVQGLPTIDQDQSYQLWVVDSKHKDPVNGGVFSVDEKGRAQIDFHPDQPADSATHFAISRERKGGSPIRKGPIVALGAL